MELSKKIEQLLFEFCKFNEKNLKNYEIIFKNRSHTYILDLYIIIGEKAKCHYEFHIDQNNSNKEFYEVIRYDYTTISEINITNEWIKLLRKKKLEKLKNGNN